MNSKNHRKERRNSKVPNGTYNTRRVNRKRNGFERVRYPLAQVLPDFQRCIIPFTCTIQNYFNLGLASGSLLLYANSLLNMSATTLGIPYYAQGPGENYAKYRVERSSITITFSSRETVKNQFLLLTPTLTPTPLIPSTYSNYTMLPWTKTTILGPISSGQSVVALSQEIDLKKLVGNHYTEQDEYAGTINTSHSFLDPATLIYWHVAYLNPDTNTITTGGLSAQISIEQDVTFYQPRRDIDSST